MCACCEQLETDRDLLIKKATRSIHKYNMHYVIANLLQERFDRVTIVSKSVRALQLRWVGCRPQRVTVRSRCLYRAIPWSRRGHRTNPLSTSSSNAS